MVTYSQFSFNSTNFNLAKNLINPLRKNGYKRTGTGHTFCCQFIPVRLSRECAIFFNGFILYFIPTLLLQSLLRVSAWFRIRTVVRLEFDGNPSVCPPFLNDQLGHSHIYI